MVFSRDNRTGWIALALFAVIVAVVVYWRTAVEDTPGDYHVKQGNYRLEDGQYDRAVAAFQRALQQNPQHALAYLGLALAHLHTNRHEDALAAFDHVLALAPSFAVAYANRGILYDRMGQHSRALQDYRQALALDPKLAKGPGWLWRFLRNIHEPPPTIADRAAYLETELRKPPQERLLHLPEIDRQQRMYKYQ